MNDTAGMVLPRISNGKDKVKKGFKKQRGTSHLCFMASIKILDLFSRNAISNELHEYLPTIEFYIIANQHQFDILDL